MMFKRIYLSGCVISALIFAKQARDEGPIVYAVGVLSWPLVVLMAAEYMRYVGWNSYLHRSMVLNKTGFYENMTAEDYETVLAICNYKRLLRLC